MEKYLQMKKIHDRAEKTAREKIRRLRRDERYAEKSGEIYGRCHATQQKALQEYMEYKRGRK